MLKLKNVSKFYYNKGVIANGFNKVNNEEVYFIPNLALGLWIDKNKFQE